MKIIINGQPKDFKAPLTLYDILEQEDMIGMMIAVAQNGNVIPKSAYKDTMITEGDILEILAPMQGG